MANPVLLNTIFTSVILPIVVAVFSYVLVDRLGEWKKRKMYSRLGVVIIESLQEEIATGVKLMQDALDAVQDTGGKALSPALLPTRSWSGMSTIPDEVLLRIIETSENLTFDGFPPRQCRTHCKNYFEHMCRNYEVTLFDAFKRAQQGQDWRSPLRALLADNEGRYIRSAKEVYQMLEYSKQLLEENAKAVFPK